jgi:hypothetical protein
MITLAMRSLNSEREAGTYDLLACSPMSPSRLVWGKWQAVMIFGVFGFTTFLPFAAASYLLGGVDIVSLVFSMYCGLLGVAMAGAIGIYASVLGKPGLMQSARMSVLSMGAAIGMFILFQIFTFRGELASSFGIADPKTWHVALIGAWLALIAGCIIYFFLNSAAARITLDAMNPQGIRRRGAFITLGVMLFAFGVLFSIYPESAPGLMIFFMFMKVFILWETMLDAASGGRVTRSMAAQWKRSLLLPGRHFSFKALLMGLLLVDGACSLMLLFPKAGTSELWDIFMCSTQISLYMMIYTIIAAVICPRIPRLKPAILILFLIAMGSIASSLLLLVTHRSSSDGFHVFHLLSPFWWMYYDSGKPALAEGFYLSSFLWLIPLGYLLVTLPGFLARRRSVHMMRTGAQSQQSLAAIES